MEDRLDLYYSGNTVIPPHPGKARRRRTLGQENGTIVQDWRTPEIVEKVCATSRCVWCNRAFGQYLVVCLYCKNCQYCGYYSSNTQQCYMCGNHLPTEFMHPTDADRLEV